MDGVFALDTAIIDEEPPLWRLRSLLFNALKTGGAEEPTPLLLLDGGFAPTGKLLGNPGGGAMAAGGLGVKVGLGLKATDLAGLSEEVFKAGFAAPAWEVPCEGLDIRGDVSEAMFTCLVSCWLDGTC